MDERRLVFESMMELYESKSWVTSSFYNDGSIARIASCSCLGMLVNTVSTERPSHTSTVIFTHSSSPHSENCGGELRRQGNDP